MRLPPLPGQGTPRPWPGVTWIHKVGEIQSIYTHSEQQTHSCCGKCQLGECQRDGGIVSTPGSTSSDVRDSWLFGEVVYIESRAVTQRCSGTNWRDFLKGGLRHARQEPHMQLPCQQGERIEGRVCSHSVQLRRLVRKVQSKGISHSQHSTSGRAEAV